jgi:hypothetical protein
VLPKWFKAEVRKKYEDFIPWLEDNWEKMAGGKISYDNWRKAEYGIDRLMGMVQFMESEDWSVRLPEMKQFLELCDKTRGNSLYQTFPEMAEIFNK